MEQHVESLVQKAAHSTTADDALKFSQAACNTANAMRALAEAKISAANAASRDS